MRQIHDIYIATIKKGRANLLIFGSLGIRYISQEDLTIVNCKSNMIEKKIKESFSVLNVPFLFLTTFKYISKQMAVYGNMISFYILILHQKDELLASGIMNAITELAFFLEETETNNKVQAHYVLSDSNY